MENIINDNEITIQQAAADLPAEQPAEQPTEAPQTTEATFTPEEAELLAALIEARVKVQLLISGVNCDKIDQAMKLAMGMLSTGMEPEEAAEKTMQEYPHLKLTERGIPVFAAESSGSTDGFSAIRNIFAKR